MESPQTASAGVLTTRTTTTRTGSGSSASTGTGTGTGTGSGSGAAASGYKRASRKGAPRRFVCDHAGCDKIYSRAEHLQRHQLNRTEASPPLGPAYVNWLHHAVEVLT
jgi:hypothetical protein